MRTYEVEILGDVYRYRLLSRRELRETTDRSGGDPILFEDMIATLATVEYPESWEGYDLCLAGVPARLADAILTSSGYIAEPGCPSPLEALAVEWGKTAQSRIDTLICFAFPGVTYSSLEEIDPEEYFRYAVGAQMVAVGLYGMDVSGFLTPEADNLAGPKPEPAPPPTVEQPGSSGYLF